MIGTLSRPWLAAGALAGAVVLFSAGAAVGHCYATQAGEARVARLERAHAEARAEQMREAALRYQRAEAAERAAVRTLQETQTALAQRDRRLREALYGLPTDARLGLAGPRLRLLNDALAAAAGAGLPAPAAEPARAAAAAAADPGDAPAPAAAAGEAELALWIAGVIGQYEECRARLEAIREWDARAAGERHGG